MIEVKQYDQKWAKEIANIFHHSVHAIDSSIYSTKQKEAWAPSKIDYDFWFKRLAIKKPLIAILECKVVGFIELETNGHIDCLYTHPDFQRRGVASILIARVFEIARSRKIERLFVEASHVVKPFFVKYGFTTLQKNEIRRNRVTLINFSMERISRN